MKQKITCMHNVVVQKQVQKLMLFLIASHRGFKTWLYHVLGTAEQMHLIMHWWCKVWKFFNTQRYKRAKARSCTLSTSILIVLLLYVSLEFSNSLKEFGCLIYFATGGIHHSNSLRVLGKKSYIKSHLLCFYLYDSYKHNLSIIKMLFQVSLKILAYYFQTRTVYNWRF